LSAVRGFAFPELINSNQAMPAIGEAQPREDLNIAGRKGIAFPHGRRQSRNTLQSRVSL